MLEPGGPVLVDDVEPLAPGAHDVVVRVRASGICHTDLNVVDGRSPSTPPLVLGHEGTGVVEEVGRDVTLVEVGDRVVGSFVPACGECMACRRGQGTLCHNPRPTGAPRCRHRSGQQMPAMAGLGTFASTMTCHEASLVPVRTGLADLELALIGCAVITGVGAVLNAARVEPETTVVVLGCGGVGQNVVQGARIAGAGMILAIEPSAPKRTLAQHLGATHALDPAADDVAMMVEECTEGKSADYVFEVTGQPGLLAQGMALLRDGGTAVAIGFGAPGSSVELPTHDLVARQKRLVGSVYGSGQPRRDIPRLVELAESGRLDVASLVSAVVSLEDLVEGMASSSSPSTVRIVVVP